MKIVLFSPTWPPEDGASGIVTYCKHMKAGLENLGHTVHILSGNGGANGTTVTEVSNTFSFIQRLVLRVAYAVNPDWCQYLKGSWRIVRSLKEIDAISSIDIFEMEESFGWHYHVQKRFNFPIIMRLHGPHALIGVFENMGENKFRIRAEKTAFVAA